jgi:hypothetical protein
MLNDISDLTVGVQQVAEFPCPDRTYLNTCRVFSGVFPYPLNTECTLFNNTCITGPVAEIVGFFV